MAEKTKIKIKIKGSAEGVAKAVKKLAGTKSNTLDEALAGLGK